MGSPPPLHAPHLRRCIALGAALGVVACSDMVHPSGSTVASVVVIPDRLAVGVGTSAPLTAEVRDAGGNLLQGRKVVWATKNPQVATVSDGGIVTGVSPGPVQVAASAEGKATIVDVTVNPKAVASIRLTPNGNVGLLVGQTRQMSAEPLDADGGVLMDRPITWSSSATTIATVSVAGLITAVAPGGAVITAASEGKTAVVAVTVSSVPVASVSVTPLADSVVVAQTLQLTAVAKDVGGTPLVGRVISWSTSDPARATVSSIGVVTGVTPGQVTITAATEGKAGTASITVRPKPVGAVILSPAQFSLEPGQTRQLTVQVTDDQGNLLTGRPVSFSTDGPSVATVSTGGLVTAIAPGSAKIRATSEGKTGTADVTVTSVSVAAVDVTPSQATLARGQTVTLTATARDASGNALPGRPATWTTGAPSIVSVSPAGVATVVGAGNGPVLVIATVEGRTGTATINVRQVSSVSVTPSSNTVFVLATRQLTATPRDAGGNSISGLTPTWSSSAPATASVTPQGLVTGLLPGTATITAAYGTVTGTASVTVQLAPVASITVAPNPASVKVNLTIQLTATLRDANGNVLTGRSVTWSSGNTTRATVNSATGLVTGKSASTTPVTITATSGSASGQSQVTVNP